jgi:sodium transport system permease protein
MMALTIFLKEFIDLLRDRRALFSALAYVAFGPLAVLFTVNTLAEQTREAFYAPIKFCGAESALLAEHLTAAGLAFDPKAQICVNVPEDFATRLADGRGVRVHVRGDLTAQATTVRKVESTLARFSSTLGNQRLLARGIAPSVTSPVIVDTQSTNSFSRQADVVARVLIILFVMAPFFISVAAAADMTAGERERRSLEPLLTHPVGAFSIVVGKWMAAALLGVLGTAACVVGGLALLDYSALAELGIRLETGVEAGLLATLYLTPLTLLTTALQVAVGLWSKNFKDAQSYLMLMSFAPAIVGFVMTGERLAQAGMWPLAWELNALAVPLLRSTTPAVPFAMIATLELALTFGVLVICAYRLRSEAILSRG